MDGMEGEKKRERKASRADGVRCLDVNTVPSNQLAQAAAGRSYLPAETVPSWYLFRCYAALSGRLRLA